MADFDFYAFLYSNENCFNALFVISQSENALRCIQFSDHKTSFYSKDVLNRDSRKATEQPNSDDDFLNNFCIGLRFRDEVKKNHDFVMKWDSDFDDVLFKMKGGGGGLWVS